MKSGELYLFNQTDEQCPPESSLWGVVERDENGIYLESCSCDLLRFRFWFQLSGRYRFSRKAEYDEVKDYFYNLGFREGYTEANNSR